jgi:hypothetical protein
MVVNVLFDIVLCALFREKMMVLKWDTSVEDDCVFINNKDILS